MLAKYALLPCSLEISIKFYMYHKQVWHLSDKGRPFLQTIVPRQRTNAWSILLYEILMQHLKFNLLCNKLDFRMQTVIIVALFSEFSLHINSYLQIENITINTLWKLKYLRYTPINESMCVAGVCVCVFRLTLCFALLCSLSLSARVFLRFVRCAAKGLWAFLCPLLTPSVNDRLAMAWPGLTRLARLDDRVCTRSTELQYLHLIIFNLCDADFLWAHVWIFSNLRWRR